MGSFLFISRDNWYSIDTQADTQLIRKWAMSAPFNTCFPKCFVLWEIKQWVLRPGLGGPELSHATEQNRDRKAGLTSQTRQPPKVQGSFIFPTKQADAAGTQHSLNKAEELNTAQSRKEPGLSRRWQSHWRKTLTQGQRPPECDRLARNRTGASSADSSSFPKARGLYS